MITKVVDGPLPQTSPTATEDTPIFKFSNFSPSQLTKIQARYSLTKAQVFECAADYQSILKPGAKIAKTEDFFSAIGLINQKHPKIQRALLEGCRPQPVLHDHVLEWTTFLQFMAHIKYRTVSVRE